MTVYNKSTIIISLWGSRNGAECPKDPFWAQSYGLIYFNDFPSTFENTNAIRLADYKTVVGKHSNVVKLNKAITDMLISS